MHAKFIGFGNWKAKANPKKWDKVNKKYQKFGVAKAYKSRSWMYDYIFRWPNGTLLQVDSDCDSIEIVDDTPASNEYPLDVAAMIWNCDLNKILAKRELKCKRCGGITNASVSKYSLLGFLRGEAKRCYISKEEGQNWWFGGCAHDDSYKEQI